MVTKDKRVALFIDGSNFYHRLREMELKDLLRFDYREFSKFLCADRTPVWQKYYIGAVREEAGNEHSKKLMTRQRKLASWLASCGWEVSYGHMLKNHGIYHEKGVDVQIAVDLLAGAYEDIYDTAILVSSDTDLIPAIDKAKSKGKEVEYIGFTRRPSYGLIAHANERRLLTAADVKRFLPE